jgi:NADH pyrophosphatase NudC (nudix superfamily)
MPNDFLVFKDLDPLISLSSPTEPVFCSRAAVESALMAGAAEVFLGTQRSRALFALNLDKDTSFSAKDHGGEFKNLRTAAASLSPTGGGVLAHARSFLDFHSRVRFCSSCGSKTVPSALGSQRECTNVACGAHHYPRVDPCALVLVCYASADDAWCLLTRKSVFPPNQYSPVAGFLEPGESLEEGAAREAQEETGVRVLPEDIRLLCALPPAHTASAAPPSSQPWPFPSSLMFACLALARGSGDRVGPPAVTVDHGELEDARWFRHSEVLLALQRQQQLAPASPATAASFTPTSASVPPSPSLSSSNVGSADAEAAGSFSLRLPVPFALSHHLIRRWALNPRIL